MQSQEDSAAFQILADSSYSFQSFVIPSSMSLHFIPMYLQGVPYRSNVSMDSGYTREASKRILSNTSIMSTVSLSGILSLSSFPSRIWRATSSASQQSPQALAGRVLKSNDSVLSGVEGADP